MTYSMPCTHYKFKDDIAPKCDAIIATLGSKHPFVKWRYFLNHIQYDDESSPVDSVTFRATVYINRYDRHFEQRITVEFIEMSSVPIDEMIAHGARIAFANFVMSEED